MIIRLMLTCLLCLPSTLVAAADATISHLLRLPMPDRLEFCGEEVPLHRLDVRERLDLELVVTLGSPVRTTLWFKRMPRYFPQIERELRNRGLPDDLKYVALVESNLRADATSYAGAVGPWQFIRGTGARYGLEAHSWKDERRDWEEATQAAADHLADLRDALGSWPLALAAYNAGEGRISRALEEQGEKDYFGLVLPRETERYVFRVLAAKLVAEDPEAYGIQLEGAQVYPERELAQLTLTVERRRLPLSAVADAAGISYWELVDLNAWMVADGLPRGRHAVVVPAATADRFGPALAQWEADNPEPQSVYYSVRRGDTLSAIAQRHRVRVRDLCAWNGISSRSIIRPGQKLVVYSVD